MSATAANVRRADSSHWYFPDGRPCYELPKKDGSGMKSPTLADAKKLGLYPSVTTILKVLDKPALTAWRIEQAVLAAVTSPQKPGESIDEFIHRVLHKEEQHEKEAENARNLGTDIHAALDDALNGRQIADDLRVYVEPVLEACKAFGKLEHTEKLVANSGIKYAGRCDAIFENAVIDFKTTKKLPKECHKEHRQQLAAYEKCFCDKERDCYNIYISTTEPGKIAVCKVEDKRAAYSAFLNLFSVWQWLTNYNP